MPNQIDKALITQFADQIHVKAQQIRARLRPYVKIKNLTGDIFAYDGLGDIESQEVTGRVQKTVFNEIEHLRRKIRKRRFVITLPVDQSDVRGSLLNPESEYSEAIVRAMERTFDRVGIEAMFATVATGRDFDTDVTFATDGGQTVDATAGLTYEKLLEIKQNFTDYEVGNDVPEKIVFGITGQEETQLFKETELVSGDFSRQFVVDKGEITRALGMEIVKWGASVQNPMLAVASSVRDCFAMSSRGLCYGMALDLKLKIQDRPDFVETTQVQAIVEYGAVRTEGVLIQKVQTTSS